MTDDRLRRWLEAVDEPRRPDRDFEASLLAELSGELGFTSTERARPVTGVRVERRARTGRTRRRSIDLLLVAAVIVTASVGLVGVAGAIRERAVVIQPPTTLLAELRQAGRIRIAIRPDAPQFTIGGQPAAGFDADVAAELARRLGVSPELVIVEAATMVAPGVGDDWDVALPSVPAWTIDPSAFLTSAPYYRWPHRLIVAATSTAARVDDVAAGPICAVAGDAGESWLRGQYGGTATAPITTSIVTRASDEECLSALASGAVVAAITAHLSDADLQVRADVRAIGGPSPEPRVVIVRQQRAAGPDTADLLRAIDDALAAMRADGTLTRLSESRFGGADLTAP